MSAVLDPTPSANPAAAAPSRYVPSHICGNPDALTPLQRDLINRVSAMGPRWAARAERYDREASFPFENYDDLRQAGLHKVRLGVTSLEEVLSCTNE